MNTAVLLAVCAATVQDAKAVHSAGISPPITLANSAVSVEFSGSTGEIVSLVNLFGSGGPNDYLGGRSPPGPPTPPVAPFCVEGPSGHYYIKTGGDPTVKTGWAGPPSDRCCRANTPSGEDCRWFDTEAGCTAALPRWQQLCLSCNDHPTPIGCPQWGPSAPSIRHALFLAWPNAPPPPVASIPGFAGGAPDPASGLPGALKDAVSPAQCVLTAHENSTRADGGPQLVLTLEHAGSGLRFVVTAGLPPGNGTELSLSLGVQTVAAAEMVKHSAVATKQHGLNLERGKTQQTGNGSTVSTLAVAFPYLTGIAIGTDGGSDCGINHFETGLATDCSLPAWSPSGGILGWHTHALWLQAWDKATGDGLGVVVKDAGAANDTSHQRTLMRFPSGQGKGGVYSVAYPASPVGPNLAAAAADVSLHVHTGGWRVGARAYGGWLRSIAPSPARSAPSWLDAVQSKGSVWIPDAATVAANRKSGRGFSNFTQLFETFYAGNTFDMLEVAMWWDGVSGALAPNYGAFGADGEFVPRADCGGAAALREGVANVHAMGRRIQLYVSGDIVHLNSTLFNASWPWTRWAKWGTPLPPSPSVPAKNNGAVSVCHAFEAWQEQVAAFVSRVIAETGVDGVRLDGVGNQASPCFNPDHHHANPYENQGTAVNVKMAGRVREAMDAVGGVDTILGTEGYSALFHAYTQTSLVMFYPGRDMDAMRVALPEYRAFAYGPDAGAIETALNGWIGGNTGQALRTTWPYAKDCGLPQLSGFPGRPCNYPSGGGRLTRWNELRPTLLDALLRGNVSLQDPTSIDPEFALRLYTASSHSVLMAARWNGSTPSAPTVVALSNEVPSISWAVALDGYSLDATRVVVQTTQKGAEVTLPTGFGFGAVVLAHSVSSLAVLNVTLSVIPAENTTTLQVTQVSPSVGNSSGKIEVQATAPGVTVTPESITLPGSFTITSGQAVPGYYPVTISGPGTMPIRRWIQIT